MNFLNFTWSGKAQKLICVTIYMASSENHTFFKNVRFQYEYAPSAFSIHYKEVLFKPR